MDQHFTNDSVSAPFYQWLSFCSKMLSENWPFWSPPHTHTLLCLYFIIELGRATESWWACLLCTFSFSWLNSFPPKAAYINAAGAFPLRAALRLRAQPKGTMAFAYSYDQAFDHWDKGDGCVSICFKCVLKPSAYIVVCVCKKLFNVGWCHISPAGRLLLHWAPQDTHSQGELTQSHPGVDKVLLLHTSSQAWEIRGKKKNSESLHTIEWFYFCHTSVLHKSIIRFVNLQISVTFIILILQLWIFTFFIFYKLCICNLHTFTLHLGNICYTAKETTCAVQVFRLKQLMHYGVSFEGQSQAQVSLAMTAAL